MNRKSFVKKTASALSEDVVNGIKNIKPQIVRQVRLSSGLFKLIGVLLFAFYPIFVSIVQSSPDATIAEMLGSVFGRLWVWVGIGIFTLLAVIHSLSMMDAPSVAVMVSSIEDEVHRVEKEVEEQHKALVFSTAVNGLSRMILNFQKAISGSGKIKEYEKFKLNCEMLFSFLVTQEDGEVVYKFRPGENWNFGIYVYSDDDKELKCVFRESSPSFLGKKYGSERSWASGEGHIGVAYALNAPQVTGDIQKAENKHTFLIDSKSHKYRDNDEDKYRSFVSAPITKISSDGSRYCIGVVYGTSNRPYRFGEEAALPIMLIADYFASAFPEGGELNSLLKTALDARSSTSVNGATSKRNDAVAGEKG